MIGIIVQLAISWVIVWIFAKEKLSVLGLFPTKRRLIAFVLFFLITAICCSTGFFMRMVFAKQQWEPNPNLTTNLILSGIWWNIKSVLFEELIFRGVLLYILIKKLGTSKAIIISAIAFGIYHWFSQELFGNWSQMAIIFLITGAMGLLLAYSYAKTFSLYIPIAIHLGWNLTQQFVFSAGPIGDQLFIPVKQQPQVDVSYFIFFCILLIPILSMFLINYLLVRRMEQIKLVNKKVKTQNTVIDQSGKRD